MYEVREGSGDDFRVLKFDGELLGTSTSHRPGNYRWVEFELYKTRTGSYILSRIGHTMLYHDPDCAVVRRNKIKSSASSDLSMDHVPCDDCRPDYGYETVAIEKPRYFALVSDTPEAVLEALYKYDDAGARYLTRVAQRLIENAGKVDTRLEKAYRVEYIL